jgi:hypothetical protein
MAIAFACDCGKSVSVAEEHAGRSVRSSAAGTVPH